MAQGMSPYDRTSVTTRLGPLRARDYFALPEGERCELIRGELYVSPSPTSRHQVVTWCIAEALTAIARGTGGLVLISPIDVALFEHSVVQPDVVYLRPERRSRVRERVEGAPDLVVEVLSPSTALRDRQEKARLYAGTDLREYWIVDPDTRGIEVLVNRVGRFELRWPAGGRYVSRTMPEVQLDVDTLWHAVDRDLAGTRQPPREG